MKLFIALIMFSSMNVLADTVINYDDGSTYTLKSNEEIYISKNNIYSLTGSTSKVLRLFKEDPWSKRDYVPEPVTGDELCWVWGGVAPPPGYSYEACFVEEQDEAECTPGGLTFGGGC